MASPRAPAGPLTELPVIRGRFDDQRRGCRGERRRRTADRPRRRLRIPPGAVAAERVLNWPAGPGSDEGVWEGSLLLGGERDSDRWWYQIAGVGGPTDDGCWLVVGGSWDRGTSCGSRPGCSCPRRRGSKSAFTARCGIDAFPGQQDDAVCLSADGRALYFDRFIGS